MGDMGDTFNAWNVEKKAKRKSNTENSTARLVDARVPFTAHNGGAHLVIVCGGRTIDFWPSTGLWMVRGLLRKSRGVQDLLEYLR